MAKNTIIMIGDGMGWEMARAAAIYKQIQAGATGTTLADFYTSGKGTGLNMQTLTGYAISTTYGTTVPNASGVYSSSQAAVVNSTGAVGSTGLTTVTNVTNSDAPGFVFNPTFNPGTTPTGGATVASGTVGNLVGYDPIRGGALPWLTGTDKEYIKFSYPDSANTATTLYSGVKTYNGAVGVDIFENPVQSVLVKAALAGKSTGLVTSVPIDHATPAAAASNVNNRNKFDNGYADTALDSILQQELRIYQPTVLLGGGHPLSSSSATVLPAGVEPRDNTYIKEETYQELSTKPTTNIYGYNFLERGTDAAAKLAAAAAAIDPNTGGRLLGLYGARGQDGNLPVSSADGDYSTTGLAMFSVNSSKGLAADAVRPLRAGETEAQFIANERNQNPTLDDLSKAALSVLSKDKDGFWLMIEGGDIDWAAHDNNLDNMIGATLDFDKAVGSVISWINANGGWENNELIVTADHDHYLTLNGDAPTIIRNSTDTATGFSTLTTNNTIAGSGQQWGTTDNDKYGWGNHSNRPVPVYYQGPESSLLTAQIGTGYEAYGKPVPGIAGLIDQVDIAQTMFTSVGLPATGFSAVAAGDATTSSGILWTRTVDKATNQGIAANLTVQLSTDASFATIAKSYTGLTDANRDYTLKVDATGLTSGTKYYYRFKTAGGDTSGVGTFKTAVDPTKAAAVRFGFSGDYDGLMRPYPSTANFGSLNLDFYANIGDTIYENVSKSSPAAADPAVNLNQAIVDYRGKYLENLQPTTPGGFASLQTLFAAQGNYTALDNHELGNKQLINGGAPASLALLAGNGTNNTTFDVNKTGTFINQTAGFKALEQVYLDYQPVREKIISAPTDARTNGTVQLYNANQWGANVLYLNTDTRSYRDVRLKTSDANGVVTTTDDTGARADNVDRTMLGKTQLAWVKQNLLDAQKNGTTWKFVSTTDPIDQIGAIGSGLDGGKSWIGGYRAERNELLKFIADNGIKNVIFLACDDHQNRINEITYLDNVNDPTSVRVLAGAISVVDGPIGATGPDVITDHTFANIKALADKLAANQAAAGVNPIGLAADYAGLKNLVREGDPNANTLRQSIDFYSPDTFNYTVFDVSADGKTLNVNVQGINSYLKDTNPEPSAANPVRSILSFSLDAAAPIAPARNDFNGDGKSDILWRSNQGSIAVWQMNGSNVTSTNLTSTPALNNLYNSWKTAGTGDFNGDGKSDILWRNDDGSVAVWTMNGSTVTSSALTSTPILAASWKTAGTGDFSGDGKSDILWRNDDGRVVLWTMDGANVLSSTATSTPTLAASWKAAGTGDFNGDGKTDILWRNDDGSVALWQMNGTTVSSSLTSTPSLDSSWTINGTADFNGDGKADILWRNTTGNVAVWQMNGAAVVSSTAISTPSLDSSWQVAGTADFSGDGKADILWRKDTGATDVWQMNGASIVSSNLTSVQPLTGWQVAAPIF